MKKKRDDLSNAEQSVLDTVGRLYIESGGPARLSDLTRALGARPAGSTTVTELLEELHPVFIGDTNARGEKAFEPTFEGWLRSSSGKLARDIVQAALNVLHEKGALATAVSRPSSYTWDELAAAASLKREAYPIATKIVALADLTAGDNGTTWDPRSTAPLKVSFTVPHDFDDVLRFQDAESFIEYRRHFPPELRNLIRMWKQAFDSTAEFAARSIYREFRKTSKWPATRLIDVQLRKRHGKSISDVARSGQLIHAHNPNDPRSRATLTFACLLLLPEAEDDREAVVTLLSALGRIAEQEDVPSDVGLTELPGVNFSDAQLERVLNILEVQSSVYVSMSSDDLRAVRFSTSARMVGYADAERFEDILLAECHETQRLFSGMVTPFDGPTEDVDRRGPFTAPLDEPQPTSKQRTIFYAWQGRLANSTNRSFIQHALDAAAKQLRADKTLTVEPVIDRDTQGRAGAPDIGRTILEKIERAAAFVGDVSIVHPGSVKGRSPNPNVLLELGYALHALGDERVIIVMNTAYGGPERLPFDLKQKRVLTYKLAPTKRGRPNPNKADARRELVAKLADAIHAVLKLEDEQPSLPILDLS